MANQAIVNQAKGFLWNNGRLLERRRFAALFEGGSAQAALAALLAYQNEDGGFGNALEPDKRCTDSQPVDQELGLAILDEISDKVGWDDRVAQRVCDFLAGITTDEGGVPFVLPSVASAPRAPWWNAAGDPPASINPTAGIAGLLFKHGVQHPWLERATAFVWRKIEQLTAKEPHDLKCALTFLAHVPDRARAEREFKRLAELMMQTGVVALDPGASGYVFKPLEFAPEPGSLCRPLFGDDVIAAHLDALAARQQADGGWPITWPPVSPACELEYRGIVTLDALKTLRAYGCLA
jgi:hypothetical protein